MKKSELYESAVQQQDTGGILSTIASIILLIGALWLALSALTGCTPYY